MPLLQLCIWDAIAEPANCVEFLFSLLKGRHLQQIRLSVRSVTEVYDQKTCPGVTKPVELADVYLVDLLALRNLLDESLLQITRKVTPNADVGSHMR